MENEELNLDYNSDEIIKICNLQRSETPLLSKVAIDEFTSEADKNFDYDFNGTSKFYPFELPKKIKDLDFQILCIIGASGSGKTLLSSYYGKEEKIEYDNTKSIMSHFANPQEAIEKLCAVGLNSIPTWCKPRNVLSNGEGFRVDLARKIKDGCVIDEFTSVVDRNVALSCANSIGNYIRKKGLKKCVFVSCHKDFLDTLKPDYVIDLDEEAVFDTRGLSKRKFEIKIYRTNDKKRVWQMFRNHHYLSGDINIASEMFIAKMNNEIVGMISVLAQPNGYCLNGFRVHRLVVLPDYQGLGIGMSLLRWCGEYYSNQNKILYIRTSHRKIINSLLKSKDWKETGRSKQVSPPQKTSMSWKTTLRTPYSFKYIKNNIKNIVSYRTTNIQENFDEWLKIKA